MRKTAKTSNKSRSGHFYGSAVDGQRVGGCTRGASINWARLLRSLVPSIGPLLRPSGDPDAIGRAKATNASVMRY